MLLETMIAIELEKEPFDFKQIQTDAVVIEQDRRRFNFIKLDNPVSDETLTKYYIWNALDFATTAYALENREQVKEGNLILGEDPSLDRLLLHKLILAPLIAHNVENVVVEVITLSIQIATVNNARLILTSD